MGQDFFNIIISKFKKYVTRVKERSIIKPNIHFCIFYSLEQ